MAENFTFGCKLREIRKARGLTQRELADLVSARLKGDDRRGFDFTYLSKIENDRMDPPSTAAILQLAAVLETDSDELLALAKKAPPDIGEALAKSEKARKFYRSAVNLKPTDEEWQALLEALKTLEEGRG
jgi:transcriptional regulator with XRE-family HTH domain